MEKLISELQSLLQNYEWFNSIELDSFNRPVVYANYITAEVINSTPEVFNNKQVLLHFYDSKKSKEDFIAQINNNAETSNFVKNEEETPNAQLLSSELRKLKSLCSHNILQDIFFEVHDKQHAVTNLSVKFPDIRRSIEKLYQEFGFDVIYDSLSN